MPPFSPRRLGSGLKDKIRKQIFFTGERSSQEERMLSLGIGVFDSGLGGLTVVREIIKQLPGETIYYLGDTAHLPYGSKSPQTLFKLTSANLKFLLTHPLKIVIIACNTASALVLPKMEKHFSIPLLGVIKPAVEKALFTTRNKKIGVIGTEQTIKSHLYRQEIHSFNPQIEVFEKACPLFVPLVEEGWIKEKITFEIAKKYLTPLKKKKIDTLILGCTHYPLLKGVIQAIMGEEVKLIDSAISIAQKVKKFLRGEKFGAFSGKVPQYFFFVTDRPKKFKKEGELFLGQPIKSIKKISPLI
jgi:glutamate racemase